MNNETKKPLGNERIIRVSKGDKEKMKGATNWAALVAEERKELSKKK